MRQPARGIVLLLALVQPGCAVRWQATTLPASTEIEPHRYAELWIDGRRHLLHRISAGADSVSGVPGGQSGDCAKCRVAYARAEIDSIRSGDPESGMAGGVLLGVATFAAAMVLFCSQGQCAGD